MMAKPSKTQRTTVYLDEGLHRALRVKSAESKRPLSALVNEAVQSALAEDLQDLGTVRRRQKERSRPFETLLEELAHAGRL